MNEKSTNKVFENLTNIELFKKENWKELGTYHLPNIDGSAGGVTFIKYDLFMNIKGFPEYFSGTWGNEDNAFAYKMKNLGFNFNLYPFEIIHLYHSHKTKRDENIKNKIFEIKQWTKKDWIKEISLIQSNWGEFK